MRHHLLTALAIGALYSAAASAGVVYDNGSTDGGIYGGNNPEAQGYYVAQDFQLGSTTALTGFTFNAFTGGDTAPTTDVNLKIYADDGGTPGAVLYSGDFTSISSAITGSYGGYTLVDFSVSLPSWSLGAGHYYIGLNAQPSQWDMHWSIVGSSPLPGSSFISGSGDPGTFSQYGFDHAFRLEGADGAVPEPASWAMMVGGFGLVGAAMRGQRRVRLNFA